MKILVDRKKIIKIIERGKKKPEEKKKGGKGGGKGDGRLWRVRLKSARQEIQKTEDRKESKKEGKETGERRKRKTNPN